MRMSNSTYDFLKWVALILLPAVVVFVTGVGDIWNLPYYAQVAATIACIDTLLGACLQVSSSNYSEKKFDEEADDIRDDIEVKSDEVMEE